jgi:hypothetical protein
MNTNTNINEFKTIGISHVSTYIYVYKQTDRCRGTLRASIFFLILVSFMNNVYMKILITQQP